MRRCKIVAVDGPAGSGKSSVCSKTCQRIGWTYVNTGFLYRSVAYITRQRRQSLASDRDLSEVIDAFCEDLHWDPETQSVQFQNLDISSHLNSDQAGQDASLIAKNPLVREKLLPLQRKLALRAPVGAIVDGRDIGTVVFPDADLKIFLTASLDERARRRLQQLHTNAANWDSELANIKQSILLRDEQDAARGAAPLKQAADAIVLDTSGLDLAGTIDRLVELIRERGLIES